MTKHDCIFCKIAAGEIPSVTVYEDEAVRAVARKAIERNIGARGLRAVLENAMMDLMFRLPSDSRIGTCTITPEVVDGSGEPELTYREELPDPKEKPLSFLRFF